MLQARRHTQWQDTGHECDARTLGAPRLRRSVLTSFPLWPRPVPTLFQPTAPRAASKKEKRGRGKSRQRLKVFPDGPYPSANWAGTARSGKISGVSATRRPLARRSCATQPLFLSPPRHFTLPCHASRSLAPPVPMLPQPTTPRLASRKEKQGRGKSWQHPKVFPGGPPP